MDKMTKAMEETIALYPYALSMEEMTYFEYAFKKGWEACHKELKGW